MNAANAFLISQTLWVVVPLVMVSWDTYVYRRFGRDATLSHAMYAWSLRFKWFALAVMLAFTFLGWHFFVG